MNHNIIALLTIAIMIAVLFWFQVPGMTGAVILVVHGFSVMMYADAYSRHNLEQITIKDKSKV